MSELPGDADQELGLFGPAGPTPEAVLEVEALLVKGWALSLPKPQRGDDLYVAVAYTCGQREPVARCEAPTKLEASAERVRQVDRARRDGRIPARS